MNLLSKSKLSFTECQKIMSENGGTLNLYYSDVEEIPDNLYVSGNVVLTGSKITKLPENLEIKGDLYMEHCNIEEIPSSISVEGGIYTYNSSLKRLPEGLKVGGSLNLAHTQITELPEDLKRINGSLTIVDTAITKLPEGLVIGRSLVAQNSQLKVLPEGLKVGGSLDIRNTAVSELPNNLIVGWSLLIDASAIKVVGKDIVVGTHLDAGSDNIDFSHLESIRIGGRVIAGADGFILKSLGLAKPPESEQLRAINESIGRLESGSYVEGQYIFADHITLIDSIETHVLDSRKYELFVGSFKYESVLDNGDTYTHCTNFWDGVCRLTHKDMQAPDTKTQ